ncbi:MarR family winged helix-turn-helix transcriptional regulator [Marinicrinis lubricantis]|uniref:MarR family winged helix-turn-helix transcriptional regulator n=1 Tax=Marinicrinis lubricantis TaxID=2086470 RepID=A0ABW1ILV1_9BACL
MHSSQFAEWLNKITRDYKKHMEEHLAPHLTEGQFHVLEYLIAQPAPHKPSDLLDYLATTPAAITTLLDRMERGGLIRRERDSQDRRIVWIHLTEKGEQEGRRGMAIKEQFLGQCLDRISAHNQQLFIYLLGKVAGDS